jgi:hypothetical protein
MRTETIFDTHNLVKRLAKTGLKERQAEEIVHAISESRSFDISNLATKADVAVLRKEVDSIKENMATKADIAEVRTEIAGVKGELNQVKYDILKWVMPFMMANTIGIIGLIVTFCFKFIQ